jgi:four helix bundle protein
MKRPTKQIEELKTETRAFAIQIIDFYRKLPQTEEAQVIGREVLRSGTTVGAKFAAAAGAWTKKRFEENIFLVSEELNETVFRLELLVETGMATKEDTDDVLHEAQRLFRVIMRGQLSAWRMR